MTIYKSLRARKSIPSNSISVNFKYVTDFIGDIETIEAIDISLDGNLGEPIGIYQAGWSSKRVKGNASELSRFTEILNVSYSPHELLILNQWHIGIKANHKKDNLRVQGFVKNIGLSIIKDWLNQPKEETWYLNRRHLQIGLNITLSKYCIFETQEANIVSKLIKDL